MFKTYRGDDVKVGSCGYVKVVLTGLGEVWATIHETDDAWKRHINNDPYSVELLGWGQAPTVWWHELTDEQRELLRSTL